MCICYVYVVCVYVMCMHILKSALYAVFLFVYKIIFQYLIDKTVL